MTLFSGITFGVLIALLAWVGSLLGVLSSQAVSRDLNDAYGAFDRGDLDKAVERAQEVWEAHPDHIEALTLLVRALIYRSYSDYLREADRDTARRLTQEAISRFQGNADVMALHALVLNAQEQYILALRLADTALYYAPGHILALMVRGMAYGGIGSHDMAMREIASLVEAGHASLDVQRVLALSYSALGRYDDALSAVGQALEQNNKLLALYFEQAEYAIHQGDTDKATAAYFRILALDPDNLKTRLRMCELSSRLREANTALRYCLEVVEHAPEWADAWYFLGREYFLEGQFEAAQESLNQCTTLLVKQHVPIEERRFECWYLQGQAAEILGDCSSLIATYNEFTTMAQTANLPQTWAYPPEGPAICAASSN